jgi:exodeoxyribonuclease-3
MKKIIAWNVNGIRSLLKTQYLDELIDRENPHIFCLGEIKMSCPYTHIDEEMNNRFIGYKYRYWSICNMKKGYSGTCIFSKIKPQNIMYGLQYNNKEVDNEGRVITLEFTKYYLIHVYTPNSGQALSRLKFRTNIWDNAFSLYINKLKKPVIICGDLNVAHNEIDLKNPKTNHMTAGFTNDERLSFTNILNINDLIDTFRYKHPQQIKYSYWSYMQNSRKKNIGWRIDYFLISSSLKNKIINSDIMSDILGSDHAPIKLQIKL